MTFFKEGLCQKLYLFHISSRINETWQKVTVMFGSLIIVQILGLIDTWGHERSQM